MKRATRFARVKVRFAWLIGWANDNALPWGTSVYPPVVPQKKGGRRGRR